MARSTVGAGSNISVSSGPTQSIGTLVFTPALRSAKLARLSGPSQVAPRTAACAAGAPSPLT
eukprot:5891605-Alexandrium_andersonii.AAC.1